MHCFSGIAGRQNNSFIDFPGIVATVLFFSGCNLRCPYCHNPSVVNADKASELDPQEVWAFLRRRAKTIDGVVFSGGEPTLHANLADAAKEVRSLGYRVKLDTNGLAPEAIPAVVPDYLSFDLKTLPRNYRRLCGSPYSDTEDRLLRSLDIVKFMGKNAEVRITCAPGFIDREIVTELASLLRGVALVFLQPLQARVPLLDPDFANHDPIPQEEIAFFRDIIAPHVGACSIRGKADIISGMSRRSEQF